MTTMEVSVRPTTDPVTPTPSTKGNLSPLDANLGCHPCGKRVQAMGLCNNHYMSAYRRQNAQLQRERELLAALGAPADYFCDAPNCPDIPVVLYAPNGDTDNAQALCLRHRQEALAQIRLNQRRLG